MGGNYINECNRVTLNGQEVTDIDISTSNEPECKTANIINLRFTCYFCSDVCVESSHVMYSKLFLKGT